MTILIESLTHENNHLTKALLYARSYDIEYELRISVVIGQTTLISGIQYLSLQTIKSYIKNDIKNATEVVS
jgi:hypothetical protein